MKTVSQKTGIKGNSRALFISAPIDAIDEMQHPLIDIVEKLTGEFDYIHLFVKSRQEYVKTFPKLKKHLNLNGMVWVSWPKGELTANAYMPVPLTVTQHNTLIEITIRIKYL